MKNACSSIKKFIFKWFRLVQGSLYRRLCPFFPVQMIIAGKISLFLDNKYAIAHFSEIFASRAYYPAIELFKKPPKVVLDLGACQGFFTLLVETNRIQRFPDAKIDYVLYEANPKMIKTIKRNVILTDIKDNIHVYCGVVGKRSGDVNFSVCKKLDCSSITPFYAVRKHIKTSYMDIMQNLAEDKLGMPELIKIDIEGSENDLFENYQELLSKACVVVLEYHSYPVGYKEWQELIGKIGLEIYEITEKIGTALNIVLLNKNNLDRHNTR